MSDLPWQGDACSLVDAFRAGERSPVAELDATLAAIDRSDLNAFSFVDPERARAAAAKADVSLPFGGVPTAIKRSEEHTSELQSLMRISYAVFCLKKKIRIAR